MSGRRVAVLVTAVVVVVVAVVLAVLRWDDANKLSTALSALAGLAAVGVGVWAALPGSSGRRRVRASRTGKATAGRGGQANTGVIVVKGAKTAEAGEGAVDDVRADKTGDADASGGGDANTGVRLD
ncbi:hypothetical protein ACIBI9_49080 [Nonomuraea sp. NPDC050451]|uniref:hypothetical protein n=1 Tax=Nonomuraea sp. NPDC050451 TaxID=3364364 RepID=UPI00379F8DA3